MLKGHTHCWGAWLNGRKCGYIRKFVGTAPCARPFQVAINLGMGHRANFSTLAEAKEDAVNYSL